MNKKHAHDLVEDLLAMAEPNIVVDMGNGCLLYIDDYYHSTNKKGETIIVLTAKTSKPKGRIV